MKSKYAVQLYCAHCRSYHAVKDIKMFYCGLKNIAQINPYPIFSTLQVEKLAIHLDDQLARLISNLPLSTNLFVSNKLRSWAMTRFLLA